MFQPKILLSLLSLLSVAGLFAQAPALSATAEEVVVTGAKFARPLAKSPEPVTIIDSAAIAQAVDLGQLLNEQAGIVVNGAYANPGKDRSIFLRNGANAFTVILVDGQPLLDPSSLGGAVDLRLLSLEGIERIEILRGAKSLLYGSDAVAGVINLVTRKGEGRPDKPSLHLRAAAQNYGTYEMGISASGGSEELSYQLGADGFATNGISEAVNAAGAPAEFGKDGATRKSINASLAYRPNERWTLRPSLRMASFDGDYDAGAFQDGANSYTNDLILPSLAVDYRAARNTLSIRYNFADTKRVFDDANFGKSTFRGTNHQADVFGTYRFSSELAYLTYGAQYRREALDQVDRELSSAITASPYVQVGMQIAEALRFEAGYRFNHHSQFGGQSNFSVSMGVQSTPTWSSHLSISSAFQSPTLDQLGGPFGPNPDLAPQTATSVELGTQLRHPEGNFQLGVTAFQRNVRDLIVFGADFTYQNLDELLDNGVEVTTSLALTKQLRLNGNLTYVKGKLTEDDGNGGTTETEDGFFRRPRSSGLLGLTYNAKKRFSARLTANYTGERPDVFFDANFARTELQLEPYLLLNAYLEYRLGAREQVRLFVDGRNLTDADFVEVTGFSVLGPTVRLGGSATL